MTEFTVAAIRFTDDVPAMRTFLTDLGLAAVTTSERWADMRAGRGAVWVHGVENAETADTSGATNLTGEVADLDALAERLTTAGLAPVVVDETYGRSLTVVDPLGDELIVNEKQTDTYGYDDHDGIPDERIVVAPVRFTDPQGAYGPFLEQLGLRPVGHADEWFAAYEADGQVGLHHEEGKEDYVVAAAGASVHLGLVTTRALEELAAALSDKGYEVKVMRDEFVSFVEVRDPDGQLVQIHAAG